MSNQKMVPPGIYVPSKSFVQASQVFSQATPDLSRKKFGVLLPPRPSFASSATVKTDAQTPRSVSGGEKKMSLSTTLANGSALSSRVLKPLASNSTNAKKDDAGKDRELKLSVWKQRFTVYRFYLDGINAKQIPHTIKKLKNLGGVPLNSSSKLNHI